MVKDVVRVSITLDRLQYEQLSRYSHIVRKPPTTVVKDLVVDFLPSFAAVVDSFSDIDKTKLVCVDNFLKDAFFNVSND